VKKGVNGVGGALLKGSNKEQRKGGRRGGGGPQPGRGACVRPVCTVGTEIGRAGVTDGWAPVLQRRAVKFDSNSNSK
jgi:hypothetical protein